MPVLAPHLQHSLLDISAGRKHIMHPSITLASKPFCQAIVSRELVHVPQASAVKHSNNKKNNSNNQYPQTNQHQQSNNTNNKNNEFLMRILPPKTQCHGTRRPNVQTYIVYLNAHHAKVTLHVGSLPACPRRRNQRCGNHRTSGMAHTWLCTTYPRSRHL
jgi:hypothetical protein